MPAPKCGYLDLYRVILSSFVLDAANVVPYVKLWNAKLHMAIYELHAKYSKLALRLITILLMLCALLLEDVFFFDHCREEHNPEENSIMEY